MMTDLRQQEEVIRQEIMHKMSYLVSQFHEHSVDVTLARAGIVADDRVHAGSSLDSKADFFDLFCLDAKERMYLILKEYDWIKDFFRFNPQHFFENSFQFVDRIPKKPLPVKVKVIGLGIGGSLAVSGLRKNGIENVIGYDKRERDGPRSVTSRFQNASWRAYEIAEKMLDEEAFDRMREFQQRVNVTFDDGTSKVMTSDRVQIILGGAIASALDSALRYGADLRFGCDPIKSSELHEDSADIVAFFSGAGTSQIFPALGEELKMYSWDNLSSKAILWLEIKMSEKVDAYTARNVEVGAEKWHFTIESARNTKEDVVRIRHNIIAKHHWNTKLLETADDNEKEAEELRFNAQLSKIDGLLDTIGGEHKREIEEETRFDYIFSNAPDNEHNRAKLDAAKDRGDVVIDGKYQVDVKLASRSMIDSSNSDNGKCLLEKFGAGVIVTGGDACVPPNPMAAYGATLACEAAAMLVQLAVAHGHINAIIEGLEIAENSDADLISRVRELTGLFNRFYDARSRSENYFQWMQTLLCNLYSLPVVGQSD